MPLHYSPPSCQKFRQCERNNKNTVTQAKDDWIQKSAMGTDFDKDGHVQCVRQLQMVYRGHQSVRTTGSYSRLARRQMKYGQISIL